MITKKIFMCEDSIDGIFTAIYEAWSSRYGHNNMYIQVQTPEAENFNMQLFSEYIYIAANMEKAAKVSRAIKEKISEEAYGMVCHAVLSDQADKGDMIYRFLILGFSLGAKVVNYLSNDIVLNIFNLNRNVLNESHHFLGFLRFTESVDKILSARIKPRNDILRLIATHFSDRFAMENFVIYDEKRRTAVVHRSGFPWIYVMADEINLDKFWEVSEREEEFQSLWKTFFNTIAIKERKNNKLQRNNLPLRFRSNMLEFLSEHKESEDQ